MPFVIGVFGTIGSGKSTVSRMIQEKFGFETIDCDAIGHPFLEDPVVKREIIKLFGLQIISKDGHIKREKLSQVVFTNDSLKSKLEMLLWPKMTHKITELLVGKKDVVLDAAVLFSAEWNILCQATIYVEASLFVSDRLRQILHSQQAIKSQSRLATYQIENNGSMDELMVKVSKIMNLIQERRMKNDQP